MSTAPRSDNRYWIRRGRRHVALAIAALTVTMAAYFASPPPDFRHRLSMGTAYAALAFLAFTLWLGPWNVFRRRPNPVSFDLRRDAGIWTGILALAHTGVGLTVHLRGRMWMYFFKHLQPLRIQNTQFGFANYTGLAAALLFLMLLAISDDLSLRSLRTRRWKSLQRWTYAAAALTVAHGIGYQVIEKRRLPWVLVFAALIAATLAMQSSGIWRKRNSENARR